MQPIMTPGETPPSAISTPPADDSQTRYLAEVTAIVRDEGGTLRQDNGRDLQVLRAWITLQVLLPQYLIADSGQVIEGQDDNIGEVVVAYLEPAIRSLQREAVLCAAIHSGETSTQLLV